jgi:hypothetical protein
VYDEELQVDSKVDASQVYDRLLGINAIGDCLDRGVPFEELPGPLRESFADCLLLEAAAA